MSKYKIEIIIDVDTRDSTINLSDNVDVSEIGYSMLLLFDYLDDEERAIMISDLIKLKDSGSRMSGPIGDPALDKIASDMKELASQGIDLSQHITYEDYDNPEKMMSIIEKLKKQ